MRPHRHGWRSGLSRLLAGSVAEEVLRKAVCPVLFERVDAGTEPPPRPARPGEVIDARARDGACGADYPMVKDDGLKVTRMTLAAGQGISGKAVGSTVLQCVEGRVAVTALGRTQDLNAGGLLYVSAGERYDIRSVTAPLVLTTSGSRRRST